jgi:putative ABC transport system ATP-binding protein
MKHVYNINIKLCIYKEKEGIIIMSLINIKKLEKQYLNSEIVVNALQDINLEIEQGQFASIIGSSGSGKTTLLHLIGGLDRPTSGSVFIDEQDIYKLSDDELTIFRRDEIGFIFQDYNLIPALSVYDNIILPIILGANAINHEHVSQIMDILGISSYTERFPNQLSGGQQQRVAIARAIVTKPSIILADEPTGNLDSSAGKNVISLLSELNITMSQTIIMVTHNKDYAKLTKRIIHLEDGKIAND